MSKRTASLTHSAALILLGIWGIREVGAAGTLTVAFWIAWFLYVALLLLMSSGSKVGAWLVLAPPALWATFSGFDLVPQVIAAFTGESLRGPTMMGALLVTLPCSAAVAIHLWYTVATYKVRQANL
jgi:hypothetical protein